MGCGSCGKNAQRIRTARQPSTPRRFKLTRRDGTTETFGSRLDAEAARARSAGGGSITPI